MHWIRRHRRGRPPHPDVLTPAEWRVLELVREGMPNAEIAVRLGITVRTVKGHVSSILAKTGLADRHALARWDGRPAEASRSVLARFGMGAPFGWFGGPAASLARIAAVGSLALAGALVVWYGASLASGGSTGNGTAVATPTPAEIAEATPMPTEIAEATPTVVQQRTGFPLEAPDLDHPGVGLVDGLPVDGVGPLVAYTRREERRAPTNRHHVEVFDVGAERLVSSFVLTPARSVQVHLEGRRLFVGFDRSVWSYALDGSDGIELHSVRDRIVEVTTPSPRGEMVAIKDVVTPWDAWTPEDSRILILDARSGDALLETRQRDAEWSDFRGAPAPSHWLDDETLVVVGFTYSGAPGGSALLRLDGTVAVLSADSYVRPDGPTWRTLPGPLDHCNIGGLLNSWGWELLAPDGSPLGSAEPGGMVQTVVLSPDESEVLYLVSFPPEELRQTFDQLAAERSCPRDLFPFFVGESEAPPRQEWRIHSLATGAERTVSDRLEAERAWYGDRVISYVCDGQELANGRYAPSGCGDRPNGGELRVGGVSVATGADFRVLGFVEVD